MRPVTRRSIAVCAAVLSGFVWIAPGPSRVPQGPAYSVASPLAPASHAAELSMRLSLPSRSIESRRPSAPWSPAGVHAQDQPLAVRLHLPWLAKGALRTPELVTGRHWGGAARALVYDGDLLWAGVGQHVLALAPGDPALDVRGVSAGLPGSVTALALDAAHERMHVLVRADTSETDPNAALVTLSTNDPSAPAILAQRSVPDARSIARHGDLLVVAHGARDPGSIQLGVTNAPANVTREQSAAALADTAVDIDELDIDAVDIDAVDIAAVDIGDLDIDAVDIDDLDIDAAVAAAAMEIDALRIDALGTDAVAGLSLFDVSDGAAPVPVAEHALSGASAMTIVGGYAYVCDPEAGVLAVVDVRDPKRSRDAGLLLGVACTALAAGPDGRTLLAVLDQSASNAAPALVAFDLAEAERPRETARLPLFGPVWGEPDVGTDAGDTVITALVVDPVTRVGWVAGAARFADSGSNAGEDGSRHGGRLRAVDLSDPLAPSALGADAASSLPPGAWPLALAVGDGRLAVASAMGDEGGAWFAQLPALDPTAPAVASAAVALRVLDTTTAPPWPAIGLHRTPGAWLVEAAVDPAAGADGLLHLLELWRVAEVGAARLWTIDPASDPPRVIGVSEELAPALLAARDNDRWLGDMAVGEGFVAVTSAGLTVIVDARDPAAAHETARAATGGVTAAMDGRTLFTAGGGSLVAWHVDDEGGLAPLGPPLRVPDTPFPRLAAAQGRLWLTTGDGALRLFDARDPGMPVALGTVTVPSEGVLASAVGSRVVTLAGGSTPRLDTVAGLLDVHPEGAAAGPSVLTRHPLRGPFAPAAALAFDGRSAWWATAAGGLAHLPVDRPRSPSVGTWSAQPAAVDALAAHTGAQDEENALQAVRVIPVPVRNGALFVRRGAGAVLMTVRD